MKSSAAVRAPLRFPRRSSVLCRSERCETRPPCNKPPRKAINTTTTATASPPDGSDAVRFSSPAQPHRPIQRLQRMPAANTPRRRAEAPGKSAPRSLLPANIQLPAQRIARISTLQSYHFRRRQSTIANNDVATHVVARATAGHPDRGFSRAAGSPTLGRGFPHLQVAPHRRDCRHRVWSLLAAAYARAK